MSKKKVSVFELKDVSYGKKFNLLGKLYLSVLSKQLKHLQLDSHFSILIIINEVGDQCSQKFIANMLHIDKAMMVGILDDLSSKGFIKRTQNPSDRREYFIHLTAKAKKNMPEIIATVNRLNKSIRKTMKQPEIKKLHTQLESIYKNLLAIANSQ
jgi:MarR family transcriptional regulator, transcriptional regulator for hemolysin